MYLWIHASIYCCFLLSFGRTSEFIYSTDSCGCLVLYYIVHSRPPEIDTIKCSILKSNPGPAHRTQCALEQGFSNVNMHTDPLGIFLTCRCGVAYWPQAIVGAAGNSEIYRADWQAGNSDRNPCCSFKAKFLPWETSVFALQAFQLIGWGPLTLLRTTSFT